MDEKTEIKVQKSIIFDGEMVTYIQKLADEAERDFSGQIRWIIKEYQRIKENK